ncbi:AraC family transcriptional regulator [Caballeronia peredens]|nr:AraC family transcriptional regulator [Caballeronia peredens]
MKASYEHVAMGEGCSVRIFNRRIARIPFEWHHHPEYELTLTMNSRGKRYIGDSVASYGGDDLVLVPPDLPHTWASNRSINAGEPQVAIVVWFSGEWARRIASCCPEYEALNRLLRRAACGLAFSAKASAAVRGRLDGLLSVSPRERLAAALDVLCALADEEAQALASPSAFSGSASLTGHEPERINRVLALVDARFAQRLSLGELAQAANLSERTLNRYFVQHVGESVGRYVNRVRIGHASRMLADTAWPVAVIAARSGFPSVANFNRAYKAAKGMTPGAYRQEMANDRGQREQDANVLNERSPSLDKAKVRKATRPRATARPTDRTGNRPSSPSSVSRVRAPR